MLQCLGAGVVSHRAGSAVFLAGSPVRSVGIVCEGAVRIVRDDFWGNRTILAQLAAGELFGETFACAGVPEIPVGVYAAEDSRILMIDYRRILGTCSRSCPFHGKLVENMLAILAEKNLLLNQKNEILSARSTRDKLMGYLSFQARKNGASRFSIPFSRQELADYLCVERSAMSAELGRMRREGLLDFRKNHFHVLYDK